MTARYRCYARYARYAGYGRGGVTGVTFAPSRSKRNGWGVTAKGSKKWYGATVYDLCSKVTPSFYVTGVMRNTRNTYRRPLAAAGPNQRRHRCAALSSFALIT